MIITIQQTVFGFHVTIVSDNRARFAQAVESLKLAVPKKNRRFQPDGNYWFIDKRAEPKLRRWLEDLRAVSDLLVREFDREKHLVTDAAA